MSSNNTDQVKLKVVTESDPKGAQQAVAQIDKVGKTADNAAGSVTSMFGKTKAGLQSISQQFEFLNKVISGLGALAIIQRIYGWFKSWREEIEKNKKAVVDLNAAMAEIDKEQRIRAVADEYRGLAAAIELANKQREIANALEDVRIKAGREREDAQTRLDEATALAAISPDDPLAAQKKGEVRAQFGSVRARREVARKAEDNTREINRIQAERDLLAESAGVDSMTASDLQKQADEKRRAAWRTEQQNKLPTIKYNYLWGNTFSELVPGDPAKQKEDAQAAASMRKEAEDLQRKADEARASAEEKSRKREELFAQIEQKIERRSGLGIEGRAVAVESSSARREAAAATEQRRQAVVSAAEDERRQEQVAALERSKQAMEQRQAMEQAQAQQRAAEAGYNYSTAKGRYDERVGGLRFRKQQGDYRGNVDEDPNVQALNSGVVNAQSKLVTATRDLANLATTHQAQLSSIQRDIDKLKSQQHNSKMGSGE